MMGDDRARPDPAARKIRMQDADERLFSPSTGRNKEAVCEAFLAHMPATGSILEIASGTGEHGAHITAAAPDLTWTYSDIDPAARASQSAWVAHQGHDRLLGPHTLDTTALHWGKAEDVALYDGLFCANMIHIAPFEAAIGLIAGAERLLRPGGRLFMYGPYGRNGDMAPSNVQFSSDLKRRNPDWGVRDLDRDILPLAGNNGLTLEAIIEMPSNNLSVIFTRI